MSFDYDYFFNQFYRKHYTKFHVFCMIYDVSVILFELKLLFVNDMFDIKNAFVLSHLILISYFLFTITNIIFLYKTPESKYLRYRTLVKYKLPMRYYNHLRSWVSARQITEGNFQDLYMTIIFYLTLPIAECNYVSKLIVIVPYMCLYAHTLSTALSIVQITSNRDRFLDALENKMFVFVARQTKSNATC
jgi:hypothetical protein